MKKIRIGIFGFGKTGQTVVGEFLKNPAMNVCWVVRKSRESQGKSLGHFTDWISARRACTHWKR